MISIVTATFNRDINTLKRAIKCVEDQTYTDWEHILVFDGVTPPENFSGPKRHTVIIERSKKDFGRTPQNVGFSVVRGDFVAVLDDDNQWAPNHLENLMKEFIKDPELKIVFCPLTVLHIDQDNRIEERPFHIACNKVDIGNWIARTEMFKKHGLLWSERRNSFDWQWVRKVVVDGQEKYTSVPERTFIYTLRHR